MMNCYQVNQHKVVLALCLIVFNLFNRIIEFKMVKTVYLTNNWTWSKPLATPKKRLTSKIQVQLVLQRLPISLDSLLI